MGKKGKVKEANDEIHSGKDEVGRISESILDEALPLTNTILQEPEAFVLENAPEPLETPTPDGSGEACHPDVLFFKDGYQGGLSKPYRYVMAMTPYQNGNPLLENPCILVSDDGLTWVTDNIKNPLVRGINNDVDIVYIDGVFSLFCRDNSADPRRILRMQSRDLVKWAEPQTCVGVPQGADALSPSVVYHDGKWRLWSVSLDWDLKYYESSDGLIWEKITNCRVPDVWKGTKRNLWHLDVKRVGEEYIALLNYASGAGGRFPGTLWLGRSKDGIDWETEGPILNPNDGYWDGATIYRATFSVEDGVMKVWYSAERNMLPGSLIWHIGFTSAPWKG